MRVLGLACSGHGASACLLEDGRILRAVNLERITRRKYALATLPDYRDLLKTIRRREFGQPEDVDYFDFYEVFPRMLRYVAGRGGLASAGIDLVVKTPDDTGRIPQLAGEMKAYFDRAYFKFLEYFSGTMTHVELEHHLAHAYQAYLSSPFADAAVLTIDGTGEKLERLGYGSITATFCEGARGRIRVLGEVYSPSSMGGVYSNVTRYLGFKENEEGTTMALAALGGDGFYREARDTVRLHPDGRFEFLLNDGLTDLLLMERLRAHCPPRPPGGPIERRHKDLAWGVQRLCEDVVLNAARGLRARTGGDRLAMAGGVALNCVANGRILAETAFRDLYVMPNAGDRGLAAGCALFGYHVLLNGRARRPPAHDFLGRAYSGDEIGRVLRRTGGIGFRRSRDIAADVAGLIAQERIVGWFQGGAEFGPRALGNRSILADPRTRASKIRLDREIKRREEFRPYAPSVLAEHRAAFFRIPVASATPYMLVAGEVRPEARDAIPAVVHADGTARVQTVDRARCPLYHRLITEFFRLTRIPMILNTSFNRAGEPMVESPYDALDCLLKTGLDALALGDFLVWKEGAPVG